MKKRVIPLIILLSLILILPSIIADEKEQVENAYSCLQNQIETKTCSKLSFEEKAFSLLAVQECKEEVLSSVSTNNCWPNGNCQIKSTAQAILALDGVNENTTLAENWLLSQNAVPKELEWFLQIETSEPATCTVSYSDLNYQISIKEDRKISSDAGSCLTLAQNDYWLQISPNCYNMEIYTSCESNNFLTTLLFKRQGSGTIHVSEDVHSSAKDGLTKEIVNALCFSKSGECDYEGSLWSTFVLHSKGYEISKYMPYLITMAPKNSNFIPESFLYFLTGKFRTELLLKQKLNQFWDESGDKYYDTALAAWPFYWQEPVEWINSKNWLLDSQEANGCWDSGNLRNTAFILRSFWPEYFTPPECSFDTDCGDGKICQEGICINPAIECGNNIKEAGEQCDGTDLNGKTCSSLDSNWEGNLSCDSSCYFDTSSCTEIPECTTNDDCNSEEICQNGICVNNASGSEPVCGNNIKEAGEQCDGTDLNGKTCSDIDSDWKGTLSCDSSCKFDTDNCKENIECENDWDCPGKELCKNGFCSEPDGDGGGDDSCDSKYDCKSNQECIDNICVDNEVLDCEDSGYFCMSESDCEGSILGTYSQSCFSPFKCCTKEKTLETCSSQGGEICSSDEFCSGGATTKASDILSYEICCVGGGECIEEDNDKKEFECPSKGSCRFDCNSDEQESLSYTCSGGQVCCMPKEKEKKSSFFIWFLLILIILAVLGIVFRDKLRPLWLKLKTKFTKKKPKTKPGMTPGRIGLRRRPLLRNFLKKKTQTKPKPLSKPLGARLKKPIPQTKKPIQLRKPGQKPKQDKGELDEVLKKLREMGK